MLELRRHHHPCSMRVSVALVFSFLSLNACSPGMFFGDGKDKGLSNGYRRVNTHCAGLQLSSAELDVPTTRQLVSCLNAQGALDPVQRLVDHLPDEDLQALVDTGNKYLLRNKKRLYQLDRTFHGLENRKELDDAFFQFGRVLENEEFVSAALAVMKEKYFQGKDGNLLKALEELSKKLTAPNVSDGLEIGISLAGSRSFSSLQKRFRGASPSGRTLRSISDQLLAYLQEWGDPHHVNAGKELIGAVLHSNLLETLDQLTGQSESEIRSKLTRMSSFLKVSLENNGRLMADTTSLFHFMRKQPISCLSGAKEVPDGVMYMIRELSDFNPTDAASYIKRKNLLTLTAMNPFCTYPPELSRYYPSLMELAKTSAMEPAADLLRVFYRVTAIGADGKERHPLAEMLANLLSDTGSGIKGGADEDTAGIKRLLPLLSELQDRNALDDILLVATLLRVEDRDRLKDILAFITAPVARMQDQSIYDVLTGAMASTSPGHLYDLLYSMRKFTDADEPLLVPAFTGLRTALYANDVHPIIDLVHDVMAEATQNKRFFDTLVKVSEQAEFKDTVHWLSEASKKRDLKDLLGAVLTLFQRFAQEGQMEIHDGEAPSHQPRRRHDLVASDLVPYAVTHETPSANDPCSKINLNLPMDDYHNPAFADQVTNIVGCLNNKGQFADVQAVISFLRSQKTEDGRDFLDLNIDLIKALGLSPTQMGYMADAWISSFDDGRFFRLLDALPFWASKPMPASADSRSDFGPVLEPLIDLARPIITSARPGLRRLQEYGGKLLRREDFPRILQYVEHLLDLTPEPVGASDPTVYDMNRIDRWVKAKECGGKASPGRPQEIVQEYRDAVTSWDLDKGKPKTAWKLGDLKTSLEPVLEMLSRPHAGNPSVTASDALSAHMRYFTLMADQKPNRYQHYAPAYLYKWLREHAIDYKLITYYYPGEKAPRVRLVNSLDRFELILINSDFKAPILSTNYGLKFLAMIGEAWGDEPYAIWPDEIKKKFPNGKGVMTLAQAVQEIRSTQGTFEGMVGFPALPDCYSKADPDEAADPSGGGWLPGVGSLKPGIYNIHQMISVLDENVANGGLKVLRDLFFEMYYSTPPDEQSDTSDDNHLNAILKLVRMGIFRQTGRNLMLYSGSDGSVHDFFNAMVMGAVSPDMRSIADSLLVKDRGHGLVWKVIENVLAVLGSQGAQARDADYFKQMVFYLTAYSGYLGFTDVMLKDVAEILKYHRDYLISHSGKIDSIFRSKDAAYLARALYEDGSTDDKGRLSDVIYDAMKDPTRGLDLLAIIRSVDEDTQAHRSWDRFIGRKDALLATPEYQQLHVKEVLNDILHFFEEQSPDLKGVDTARRLRIYLAERAESGELDQMLILAKKNPTEFYRLLSTLSHEVENGDLKDFFRMVRRSMSTPR